MANANDLVIKRERKQLSDAFNSGRMRERNAAMMIGKAHPPGQPGPPNPDPSSPYERGKSPHKVAHGKFFDDYGRIKKKPRGMTPSGKPFDMPVDKEQQKKNKERHDRLYHPDLMISQSPAALDALRKGLAPGLSSQQIRSLIKPYTKQDRFGHPTGSLRGV